MDDEEFEEEDFEDLDLEPRPMTVLDMVIAVWCLIGCCVEALAAFGNHVARLLVAHRNYKTGQRDFADAIRADLDSIPTEEKR